MPNRAEARPTAQGDHAPPPQRPADQVEGDAQQPVDRGLQHHPAHQRRDRRGRRRMRLGQPDVQRQHARLRAEAEQREQERGRAPDRLRLHRAHGVETVASGAALQRAETHQDRHRADVRDQQVQVARPPDLGVAMVGGHEEERRQRHRLPGHHEEIGVVGHQHQRHAGEKHVVVKAQQARQRAFFAVAEIAAREYRDARRHAAREEQEERRQGVHARVKRQVRQSERQDPGDRFVKQRNQRHARQQDAD